MPASNTNIFHNPVGWALPTKLPVTEEESEHLPPSPPTPPRAITKGALRRSWAEPRVRNSWLIASAMFLIALFFAGSRLATSFRDYSLIKNGTRVEASIIDAEGGNRLKKLYPPESRTPFHMSYRLPDGTLREITEPLKDQRKAVGPG